MSSSAFSADRWFVRATLLITGTFLVLSSSALAPTLPTLESHFLAMDPDHAARIPYEVNLVLTLPAICTMIGGAIVGQWIDRWGRKPLLILATVIFSLAGASGFFLESLPQILIGRAILGFANACIGTSVTTLIADYYQDKTRSNLMGQQSAVISLGGVVLLSISGFLADINWRLPFLLYLFPLVVLPFIITLIQEPTWDGREELLGASASRSRPPWANFPWGLVLLIYGVECLQRIAFFFVHLVLPFYVESRLGLGGTFSGLALSTLRATEITTALTYSRIQATFGFVGALALAFFLAGLGLGWVALASSYGWILGGMALAGFGFGLFFPNGKVWLAEVVIAPLRGRVLGGMMTALCLGEFMASLSSEGALQWLGFQGVFGGEALVLLPVGGLMLGLPRIIQFQPLNLAPSWGLSRPPASPEPQGHGTDRPNAPLSPDPREESEA